MSDLPYTYTDEGSELTVTDMEISVYEDSEPRASRVNIPQGADAVALARAILATDGNTGHIVVSSEENDAVRARGFELTSEVRQLLQQRTDLRKERDTMFEEGARWMREQAADRFVSHEQALQRDIALDPTSEHLNGRLSGLQFARTVITDLPLLPGGDDTVEAREETARTIRIRESIAADSMRDRIIDLLTGHGTTDEVIDDIDRLLYRAPDSDTIEIQDGHRNTLRTDLADDIDQLQRNIRQIKGTTCPSFTADPGHSSDALYCDHPGGEGHTGHHYADTWTWADATESGSADPAPAHDPTTCTNLACRDCRVAARIFEEEQALQQQILKDPTNPRLNGVLGGLQRARDIATETPSAEDFDSGWTCGYNHARADETRIAELEKQLADLADLVHGHGEDLGQAKDAIRGLGSERIATRPYNAWTDG